MSLGSAIGGVGGAIVGGIFGASSASQQRAFAKREAKKTRDWQQEMYSRRYRRTTADMKAAGLNPILAYKQGTGGGVPSGATASSSLGQEAGSIAAGASKGIEGAIAMATAEKIQQDTLTSAAQEAKLRKEIKSIGMNEPYAKIMSAIADHGIEPLIQYLISTITSAKEGKRGSTKMYQSLPPTTAADFNKKQRQNQSKIKGKGTMMFPNPVPPVQWRQYK